MIDSNHHHVLLASEICPIVKKPIARSAAEATSVQPDHDRPAPVVQARCVDVDLETVFAHRLTSVQGEYFRDRTLFVLRRPFTNLKTITNTSPVCRFRGRHKAVGAGRRCGVRNSVELIDPVLNQTTDFSRYRLHRSRGVCAASVLRERDWHDAWDKNGCRQE